MNGDSIAALEEIKPPPGVVLPPKEIKGSSPSAYIALSANINRSYSGKDSRLRRSERAGV
jgi:hypothetical protein